MPVICKKVSVYEVACDSPTCLARSAPYQDRRAATEAAFLAGWRLNADLAWTCPECVRAEQRRALPGDPESLVVGNPHAA